MSFCLLVEKWVLSFSNFNKMFSYESRVYFTAFEIAFLFLWVGRKCSFVFIVMFKVSLFLPKMITWKNKVTRKLYILKLNKNYYLLNTEKHDCLNISLVPFLLFCKTWCGSTWENIFSSVMKLQAVITFLYHYSSKYSVTFPPFLWVNLS